jgi:hypothetical protein
MLEQQKANRARMIGYVLGIVIFAAIVAWKYLTR